MADQPKQDKDFETYLTGHSSLSDLYRQAADGAPSEMTDQRILRAAKEAVTTHHASASPRGLRWRIPAALAASLIIAFLVVRMLPPGEQEVPAPLASQQEMPANQHQGASHATPEHRLQRMVEYIEQNKSDEARQEYHQFRTLFPNYEIDFKKYPALKTLAE